MPIRFRFFFVLLTWLLPASLVAQPENAEIMPLSEVKPGMKGEVWTVFRGTKSEPFTVEVTGVVANSLGPGRSVILCELTDPKVQGMGAVAGMSGSPLYIAGRFAGALSYQVQRFETTHYAGFTPATDMEQVADRARTGNLPANSPGSIANTAGLQPMQPAFTISGLSPAVTALFASRFAALGMNVNALGGNLATGGAPALSTLNSLRAGDAVSVGLATGDISLAGTGTVSRVKNGKITAFGHPMLSLGDVELPMCMAEIVTILPSTYQSIKVANTGPVIGTITQDRLSGIAGTLGPGPRMTQVEILVKGDLLTPRRLQFQVSRHPQLTPALIAAGITQAIVGSNDGGLNEGFRITSSIVFPAARDFTRQTFYAGPQGFADGLNEFVQYLGSTLINPYDKIFPDRVAFTVEALRQNPLISVETFQLSRTTARAGETVEATFTWRDYQGAVHREILPITVDPKWIGKKLDVMLVTGPELDRLTGQDRMISAAQIRGFDSYLNALKSERIRDGLNLVVLDKARLFSDQTDSTVGTPNSIERTARRADGARFHAQDTLVPLYEKHLLPGRLGGVAYRRALTVVD